MQKKTGRKLKKTIGLPNPIPASVVKKTIRYLQDRDHRGLFSGLKVENPKKIRLEI